MMAIDWVEKTPINRQVPPSPAVRARLLNWTGMGKPTGLSQRVRQMIGQSQPGAPALYPPHRPKVSRQAPR